VTPAEVRASTRTLEMVPAVSGVVMFVTSSVAAGQLPPLHAAMAGRAAQTAVAASRSGMRTGRLDLAGSEAARGAQRRDGKFDLHA